MPQPNSPVPPHRYDHPTAGRVRIEVQDGYPAFCDLYVDGRFVVKLHHRDLADASFVVSRAKDAAREKLGAPHFREV